MNKLCFLAFLSLLLIFSNADTCVTPNCNECDLFGTICTNCNHGYQLLAIGCVPAPTNCDDPNCKSCTLDRTICTDCYDGYIKTGVYCIDANQPNASAPASSISIASTNATMNLNYTNCTVSNCLSCDVSGLYCSQCSSGFLYNGTNCLLANYTNCSDSNCDSCDVTGFLCSQCRIQWTLSGFNCTKKQTSGNSRLLESYNCLNDPQCAACSDIDKCSECISSSLLLDNQCVSSGDGVIFSKLHSKRLSTWN